MKKNHPNIIYILGDDHRQDFLGAMNHPVVKTPNLDRLAKEGVFFENAFCTSPLCTPSRACHYTGMWERSHGINFNSLTSMSDKAFYNTFPMLLKQQGYFTGWVGKNHVPIGENGYEGQTMEKNFDYWYGNHRHSFFYPKESERGKIYRNATHDTQVEIFEEGAMNFLDPQPDFINSCAFPLSFRDRKKPFCLCITFNLPHDSSTEGMQQRPSDGELYINRYRDCLTKLPVPKTYVPYDQITTPRLPKDLYNGDYLDCYNYVRSLTSLKERQVRICQTVTGMDRMIGHLCDKLKELGEDKNTVIIFSTDHGIHHGEHGLGGKSFLYEEDLRIPLIIYDPRLRDENQGKRMTEMVAVPDLAPTVLDLAGYEIPETMQGNSLVPLMNNTSCNWRKELFIEQLFDNQNYPKSEGIRTAEWKYIRYFKRHEIKGNMARFKTTADDYLSFLSHSFTGEITPAYEELYHLTNDPYEETNLAFDSSYASTLAHFRTRTNQLASEKITPDIKSRVTHYTGEMIKSLPVLEDEKALDAYKKDKLNAPLSC